jgi:hypothetical protein
VDIDDVPAPIRAFIDATNDGDSARFVAAFTDDAHLEDWGRHFHGHDRIADWDRTDNIGVRSHFDLISCEPGAEPETYVVVLRVTGNGFNGTGPFAVRLRDGLIADVRIS